MKSDHSGFDKSLIEKRLYKSYKTLQLFYCRIRLPDSNG